MFFDIDVDTPGLIRAVNSGASVPLDTLLQNLEWPRRILFEIASFTVFTTTVDKFMQIPHSPVLTPATKGTKHVPYTSVRVFPVHFSDHGHALQYDFDALRIIIERLERRLNRLELAVANGTPLELTLRNDDLGIPHIANEQHLFLLAY